MWFPLIALRARPLGTAAEPATRASRPSFPKLCPNRRCRPSGLRMSQESISDDISTSTILTPNPPIASSDGVKGSGRRCTRPAPENRHPNSAPPVRAAFTPTPASIRIPISRRNRQRPYGLVRPHYVFSEPRHPWRDREIDRWMTVTTQVARHPNYLIRYSGANGTNDNRAEDDPLREAADSRPLVQDPIFG
jgi:hypothetical protein